ncbi:Gfo/Idh/MocA family oxidoreductase [Pikeienuella piscinae]|uniref:Gfo/Idh/MocA family oxidoreductase n=1 Tax=Pikeienuella piscinae TaxID=2748098 RepID=A0A7L5BV06_9RHOB|nr:Gfo/Idh/MocA family oxidoreductase [Pikeienuella piscinae]QIE54608.1 Gfo/Idh/MocA family oxidoreductase [Pikeienuella piscinae]
MARIRLGMVGGGRGAFIGGVHRIASRLDDHFELVAGCFSADADRSCASGGDLGLTPHRVYSDFDAMAKREARLKAGVEAVAIVTPNHMHAAPAKAFLRRGVHVICDKPMTTTLREAKSLAKAVESSDALFILTHNYTGYPMVRQAREMIRKGALGAIRLVQVEYAQDWLTEPLEETGQKQAAWRTDPARSGPGGAIGDIGTHAFNLVGFITGLEVEALSADLQSFVPERRVDDNAHVMLRLEDGARGMLWCSQIAPGNENALRVRIYGAKGGLEWAQEAPDTLWHAPLGEPKRRITRAGPGAGAAAARMSRTPAGHPEGYLEGFANIYAEAAAAIRARQAGAPPEPAATLPGVREGLAGVAFVDACIRSSTRNGAWVRPAV